MRFGCTSVMLLCTIFPVGCKTRGSNEPDREERGEEEQGTAILGILEAESKTKREQWGSPLSPPLSGELEM